MKTKTKTKTKSVVRGAFYAGYIAGYGSREKMTDEQVAAFASQDGSSDTSEYAAGYRAGFGARQTLSAERKRGGETTRKYTCEVRLEGTRVVTVEARSSAEAEVRARQGEGTVEEESVDVTEVVSVDEEDES